jgi:hypothetical protein
MCESGTRRSLPGRFDEAEIGVSGGDEKDFVGWAAYLRGMALVMELRHLRYFVAVAEEGSLTVAAERRLHTAQPSLSRQIRDLEDEVGVPLLTRSARGIALTAAGRAFLEHARLTLAAAEAAVVAARRAGRPAKPSFAPISTSRCRANTRRNWPTTWCVGGLISRSCGRKRIGRSWNTG